MATGIITSATTNLDGTKSGEVRGDESGDTFPFSGQTLTCDVGDPVTFDLNISKSGSTAVNLACMTTMISHHPKSPLTTEITEDVTVTDTQKFVLKDGGKVTGQIVVNGGKLRVTGNGKVTGGIQVNKGGRASIAGGSVDGDVTLNEAEVFKVKGGGKVTGNITVIKGHKIVCDEGTIEGVLDLQTAVKIVVKASSKIGKTC